MFYKPNNKIIIVDDIQQDLDILSKEFHKNGIGCMTYLYDLGFDTPLKDVRIAFFDIDINPSGGGSEGQRFNSLALAIQQYIHKDNGPFALIFWTKKVDDVENLSAYINRVHTQCPKPFLISCLDKGEFSQNSQEQLQAILSDKTLELLFDFEEIASKAASKTINQIFDIIPKNEDPWGTNQNFKVNFERIFSKICASALGSEHAKKNPDKAVYEALIPVLNYHISSNINNTKWGSYLTSLQSSNNNGINGFNYGLLNSIFHIETSSNIDIRQRGAVVEFYPMPPGGFRIDYFKRMSQQSGNLFQKFVQFDTEKVSLQEIDTFKANSRFIVIEISAACDHSQNKARNSKYVLGLLSPFVDKEKLNFSRISDSIFFSELPVILFNGKNHMIWINFNFTFSGFEIAGNIRQPLFLFKKEIMDMIGNRYANHVARIGITSF